MKKHLLNKYPGIEVEGEPAMNECCIIDSRVHGLFACFYCVLYGLFICEKEKLRPTVILGADVSAL